jgi:hypothetical protein
MDASTVLNDPFLLRYLLLQADYDTVLEYCRSHLEASRVCYDNIFWQQKAEQILNVPKNIFHNTNLSAAQRYLQLLTEKGGVAKGSEKYIDLEEFVRRAIRQNRNDLFQYAINLGFNYWIIPLIEYAAKGNKELVDYYLTLEPDYQKAAEGALRGGHIELFNYIRSLAPINYDWRWSALASMAAGNKELFNYVISLVPNYRWNWNYIASDSLSKGNKEMFDYIRSLVPNYQWNWNVIAGSAPNKDLFNYVKSLVSSNYNWNYSILVGQEASHGNKEMFDYIRSLAPQNYQWNWNIISEQSLFSHQKDMFNYIHSLAPYNYQWDWNLLASATDNEEMFDYVQTFAPPDYQWNWNNLITEASENGNTQFADYLSSLAQ